jgi:hypothetical protein
MITHATQDAYATGHGLPNRRPGEILSPWIDEEK